MKSSGGSMLGTVTSDILLSPEVMVRDEETPRVALEEHRLTGGKRAKLHSIAWLCIALACLGMSWFSCQYFLVPQPKSFAPDWHGAGWVQAADSKAPVAYFRSAFNLNIQPDAAFITISASQNFYLFLNGQAIGSNNFALKRGEYSQTYMYSVTSFIQLHANVIAVRVANNDEQTPALRLSIGIVNGKSVSYYGTGNGWQATDDVTRVYPHNTASLNDATFWTTTPFDSSSWLAIQHATYSPAPSMLNVDPQVYEQPMPVQWMSAGLGHDAYFVRRISLSSSVSSAWLRIAATGSASIYVNNQLLVVWNGRPPTPSIGLAYYFSPSNVSNHGLSLATGVYDVSPYLHAGENVIAVHVAAPGVGAIQNGSGAPNASMSLDMIVNDAQRVTPGSGWHVSNQAVEGWERGNDTALAWPAPLLVNRPGTSRFFYQPDSSTTQNAQVTSLSPVLAIAVYSLVAVVGLWLLLSLLISRRYQIAYRSILEMTSLAYLPALACEALLIVLSFEPQMPHPFPYTSSWALALVLLVGAGYILLWRHAHGQLRSAQVGVGTSPARRPRILNGRDLSPPWLPIRASLSSTNRVYRHLGVWLSKHWILLLIMLIAIPLVTYNLAYDPYWQDELTSYYAAKGVLVHGLPIMPSGFFYTKGELYSYVLALNMLLFGDQNGAPRLFSALEYLACIPALYIAGRYFFDRRVALLATALFAFSPFMLGWGREMRMYQQAQLLTILVVYLFYRALQERQNVRLIYIAVGCLVAAYLSHEESFIIFPALVFWVVVASRDEKHRYFAALYQKHWWIAGTIGASIIITQLLIAHISHPAPIGTDSSQRPFIQFGSDAIPYYTKLLFLPWMLSHGTLSSQLPYITVHSMLATMGCVWAMRRKDRRAWFCAWVLVASLLTLVLIFTMQSDRYLYPLLPIYYLMVAYALHRLLRALWRFARSRSMLRKQAQEVMFSSGSQSRLITMMMVCTTGLVCACLLILPILPIANYNLFISRVAGFSYQRQHPDYDNAGRYIHDHWRKGDIVIALSPSLSVLYYVGQVDYFFSTDRALYLFERDSEITDTPTGTTPIFNQGDFQAVLASHARIWIVANGSFQNQTRVQINGRIIFPPDIHLVYEGYSSAVYLRGG
jgi:uncharacterized membrane protein